MMVPRIGLPAMPPAALMAARWAFTMRGMDPAPWASGSTDAAVADYGPRSRPSAARSARTGPPYRDANRSRMTAWEECGHAAAVRQLFGPDCVSSISVFSSADAGSYGVCSYYQLEGATLEEKALVIAGGAAGRRLFARLYGLGPVPLSDSDASAFASLGLDAAQSELFIDQAEDFIFRRIETFQAAADAAFRLGHLDGADFDTILKGA